MMWIPQEQDMFSTDTDLIYQTQWTVLGCYRFKFHWLFANRYHMNNAVSVVESPLQWRHDERDEVPNDRRLDCLLNRCSGEDQRKYRGSASLACEGNPPVKRIYLTNGQIYGKCFYLMTSSWSWLNGFMMTSSNADIFCVTGPLCGDFTGHLWIPLTKASDGELWCFL